VTFIPSREYVFRKSPTWIGEPIVDVDGIGALVGALWVIIIICDCWELFVVEIVEKR
jgi:hypothetical protein